MSKSQMNKLKMSVYKTNLLELCKIFFENKSQNRTNLFKLILVIRKIMIPFNFC